MVDATVVDAPSNYPKNVRPLIMSYTSSMWADIFTSCSLDNQVQEKYAKAIEELKDEARSMLMAEGNTTSDKLVLIDTLERLGVAYHFEQQIEDHLQEIFKSHSENSVNDDQDYDMYTVALQFRLLRQHRHYASCNVFNKFLGNDNKFKESLNKDAKGLLSLYEATNLRIHEEEILEEALAFTRHHLNHMLKQQFIKSLLEEQVKRALVQPLHRGVPRIETRYYISFYEKDESRNELLLRFAKLDFNYVQNVYKKELHELTRWWNEFALNSIVSYARVRVVESFLWGSTIRFEPQYSYARVETAKRVQMLTILDDTYDNYATLEEGDLFIDALERWNIKEIGHLPDYMKAIYKFVLTVYDEYEREATKQGTTFAVPYAIDTVKQITRAYNQSLKWFMGGKMTTFNDYILSAITTSCLFVFCSASIPGMTSVSKETIDWLKSVPKIIVASAMTCRYLDDLSSYTRESKEGNMMTGVDWYMKHHGVSLKEATDKFVELAEDAWKDMNAEWMTKTSIPKDMMVQVLNYARIAYFSYGVCKEGFSNPEIMAPEISALFVDPIII